jgi:hypothetical protein
LSALLVPIRGLQSPTKARPAPSRRRRGCAAAGARLDAPLADRRRRDHGGGSGANQPPVAVRRALPLEQKKEFLDSLVRFEVLAKEAYRRGMDKDPEVVRTMKQVMIQKLMRDEFDAKVTADTVADAEMKAYYDANIAEYVKPEEVRVSAIILKNKAQADRVALEARGDAGKTNKGFRDLVMKYSADEDTKLRGATSACLRCEQDVACRVRRRSRWPTPATCRPRSMPAMARSTSSSRPAAASR